MKALDIVGLVVIVAAGLGLVYAWRTGMLDATPAAPGGADRGLTLAEGTLTPREKARLGILTLADCPPGSTGIITMADGTQSCQTPLDVLAPSTQAATRALANEIHLRART